MTVGRRFSPRCCSPELGPAKNTKKVDGRQDICPTSGCPSQITFVRGETKMPKKRTSKTYNFETDVLQYNKLSQENLDFARAGNLYLESEPGEVLEIPFVWWYYRRYYSYVHRKWEGFDAFLDIDSSSESGIDSWSSIAFQESDSGNLFYLAFPKKANVFMDLDDAIVVSKTSDPTKDDNIFKRLIAAEYELNYVEEIELDFNNNVAETVLPSNDNWEAQESVQSTPEPSAISGMVLLGVLFVGVIAKRAASKLRSPLRTGN